MIYDSRDRLVFMQDGNQAALSTPQWTATLYDDLDRATISTLYNTTEDVAALSADITAGTTSQVTTSTPSQPITNLVIDNRQAGVGRYAATTSIEFTTDAAGSFESQPGDEFVAEIDPAAATGVQNISVYTQNTISPSNLNNPAVCTILKYFFYDDYSFTSAKAFNNNFNNTIAYSNSDVNVLPIVKTIRTINFSTGSLTRVLGSNTFLGTTAYYDEKGHAIQTLEENIKSGTDISTLQYGFDGRVLSSCSDHSAPGTGFNHFITLTKYDFDKIGRATGIEKQFTGNPFKTIATYDYDDMGRVKTKHLDPSYIHALGQQELETLNYSFNIHNQITGINKDYALKANGYDKFGHSFGMYLGFDNKDNVFTRAQLNGQVTGLLWNTLGDDAQRKYDYSYDNAGRLINASFTEQQHPGEGWSNAKMDFSVSGSGGQITYDLNGNLLTMLQKGVIPGTATPITIDDLHYTYASLSNKLQSVTDLMTTISQNGISGDFKDGSNNAATPDYVYDYNGNLVIDLNKNVKDLNNVAGANGISYNFLDKPELIKITGKGTIRIIYSADGEKLQRIYTPDAGVPVTTSYINGFVYQSSAGSDALSYFNFEEGRIRVMTANYQNNGYDIFLENGNMVLPNGKMGVYDYFITDYQKNVRMILTEETHTAANTATMETSRAEIEDPVFGQTGAANEVEATRYQTPPGWQPYNSGNSVSRLGNIAGHNIGPNVLQKVMAGDQVHSSVQYYYQNNTGGSNPDFANTLLASLGQALGTGVTSGSLIHNSAANITSQLNGSPAFLNAIQPPSGNGGPKAYLTILFFDERFKLVSIDDGGVLQAQTSVPYNPNNSTLDYQAIAPKNGYVYTYVSNLSDQDVYFDNFLVSVGRGNILEENHYYAYGLKISALSSHIMADPGDGAAKNNYQYNDKEMLDEDADLNWLDYGFRNYDPQIGRFPQLDPLTDDYPFLTPFQYASNDPITNIDIDGLEGSPGTGGISIGGEFAKGVATDFAHSVYSAVVVTAVRHSASHVAQVSTLSKVGSFSLGVFKGLISGAKGLVTFVTNDAWQKSTWVNTGNLIGSLAILKASNGNVSTAMSAMSWIDSHTGTDFNNTLDNLSNGIDKFVKDAPHMNAEQWGNATGQVIFAIAGTKGMGALKNVSKVARFAKGASIAEDAVSAEQVLAKEGIIEDISSNAAKGARQFTKSNFRRNLIRESGVNPGKAAQAHHVFPQKFEAFFSAKGIDIHNPKFGSWWETTSHLENASDYNAAWEQFLRTNPSANQIINQGRRLMHRYGITVGF